MKKLIVFSTLAVNALHLQQMDIEDDLVVDEEEQKRVDEMTKPPPETDEVVTEP
jgi:hypothetical protein